MIKLISIAVPISLFVFGQVVLGVIALFIPFFVFFVSRINKGNKQQPGESDEEYAERMARLKEAVVADNNMSESKHKISDPMLDPTYSMARGNVYHNITFNNRH